MPRGVRAAHNRRTETRHHPEGKVCNHFATYAITCDQYDDMLDRAGHRCEICWIPRAETTRGMLFVDHVYEPWHVRGLLCGRCNSVMAAYDGNRHWRPDPEFCRRAALYVANSWQLPNGEIRPRVAQPAACAHPTLSPPHRTYQEKKSMTGSVDRPPGRRSFRVPLPGNLDGIALEFPAEPLTAEQWQQFMATLEVWRPALMNRPELVVSLQPESETA